MKSPIAVRLLLLSSMSLVTAQDTTTAKAPDPNSDFYQAPSTNIDFPGCFSDLVTADRNGDGLVKSDEYLGFIQEYGKRKCIENPELTLQQRIAFNTIACACRSEEGAAIDCCIGNNAQIQTAGAMNPARTGAQQGYLTSACRITDATLPPPACPPIDDIRKNATLPPLPPIMIPPAPRSPSGGGGLPIEALWGIIAAALLLLMLLCCCCGFVLRKQKPKDVEEEEEEVIAGKGMPPSEDVERNEPPEASSANVPPPVIPAAAKVATDDESEEEEEGSKDQGGGLLGEEDEEAGNKRYVGPRYPLPKKESPGIKLRPIEKEDEENPVWDQPGRQLDYPKEKDEDPGQVLDRYVPDGGVYLQQRPEKDPVEFNPQWERGEKEEPDESDRRKHRIQSGLGEGEVWNKLDEEESDNMNLGGGGGDVFDWVVQSALGVLDQTDEAGLTNDDDHKY